MNVWFKILLFLAAAAVAAVVVFTARNLGYTKSIWGTIVICVVIGIPIKYLQRRLFKDVDDEDED